MMYTVGEMARLLGVPASTLRYYDKEGLLPFVERSPGGMRMFQKQDYEWLQVISCLKKAGMPLKDIRAFIAMTIEGDSTIDSRLELIRHRREAALAQMAELRQTLEVLDFKCWYYETAKEAGSIAPLQNMSPEDVPERFQATARALRDVPTLE